MKLEANEKLLAIMEKLNNSSVHSFAFEATAEIKKETKQTKTNKVIPTLLECVLPSEKTPVILQVCSY